MSAILPTPVQRPVRRKRAERQAQRSVAGQTYLVTVATLYRRPVFLDDEAARAVCRVHIATWPWRDARLLAWVLMPAHWQGLVTLGERDTLSTLVGRFKALTSELGKQYASYEAAPGIFINGDLTMGENIGDMSGLEVAYEAYRLSLGGKPAPVIDGLTGDQRFFLAFAQAWRGEQRDDAIKTQVASDPHSPRRYRVIGPLRNLDAWYAAFNVKPGSKFYIPPEQRVRIW